MYAADLINKDGKHKRFYFARMGRQIRVDVYEDFFLIIQLFSEGNVKKYKIEYLDKAIGKLKNGAKLIETINYR